MDDIGTRMTFLGLSSMTCSSVISYKVFMNPCRTVARNLIHVPGFGPQETHVNFPESISLGLLSCGSRVFQARSSCAFAGLIQNAYPDVYGIRVYFTLSWSPLGAAVPVSLCRLIIYRSGNELLVSQLQTALSLRLNSLHWQVVSILGP
ncbi:hypothetical protein Tco_0308756 [Tanacetum coccineum]